MVCWVFWEIEMKALVVLGTVFSATIVHLSSCCDTINSGDTLSENDSGKIMPYLCDDSSALRSVINEDSDSARVIFESDPTLYSERFINGLKEYGGYKSFTIKDSTICMERAGECEVFPDIPKIGTEFLLTGKKDHLAIALKVQRINYTTIDYSLEMVEFGNSSHNISGEADIQSLFFLGAEIRYNSYTDEVFFVTEFSDNSKDSCFLKIGLQYDENGTLWGWIDKNCNGKVRDVSSDDFPTLVEK